MKHLVLFCLVIVLGASCSQEVVVQPVSLEPENNIQDLTELEVGTSTTLSESPIDIGPEKISEVNYFLDGAPVEEGEFEVTDLNLHIVLRVEQVLGAEKGVLSFTYHAFHDVNEYYEWGNDNQVYLKTAHEITSQLETAAVSTNALNHYYQTGRVPSAYAIQSKSIYENEIEFMGDNVKRGTSVLFADLESRIRQLRLKPSGTPVMNAEWSNEVSAFTTINPMLPTIMFSKTFYREQLNPVISIEEGIRLELKGDLAKNNDKAMSWF